MDSKVLRVDEGMLQDVFEGALKIRNGSTDDRACKVAGDIVSMLSPLFGPVAPKAPPAPPAPLEHIEIHHDLIKPEDHILMIGERFIGNVRYQPSMVDCPTLAEVHNSLPDALEAKARYMRKYEDNRAVTYGNTEIVSLNSALRAGSK